MVNCSLMSYSNELVLQYCEFLSHYGKLLSNMLYGNKSMLECCTKLTIKSHW